MKNIMLIGLFFLFGKTDAQIPAYSNCIPLDSGVNLIFPKGEKLPGVDGFYNRFELPSSFFANDFCFQLADTSYKLLGFRVVFNYRDETINYTFNNDALCVDVNRNELRQKIKKINDGGLVTIERTRVAKEGVCYELPICILFVKDKKD